MISELGPRPIDELLSYLPQSHKKIKLSSNDSDTSVEDQTSASLNDEKLQRMASAFKTIIEVSLCYFFEEN
jgi:hypothetical protein